ncbi:MAG: hypothetical protein H6729_15180 [Deltaproteobacteria bacterium]|nr:hypothetical protein [Deltaproteobacteria bacterium]
MMSVAFDSQETLDRLRVAASGPERDFRRSALANELVALGRDLPVAERAQGLRTLLGRFLDAQEPRIPGLRFPDAVKAFMKKDFQRLRERVEKEPDAYFDLREGHLRMDFCLAGFGRVPVGPVVLESDGLSRSLVYQGPKGAVLKQGIDYVRLAIESRGNYPYFSSKWAFRGDSRLLFHRRFGPDAQKKMYRLVAECLKTCPEYKGYVGTSWWNDPELHKVTPGLAQLTQLPMDNGGLLFRTFPCRDAFYDAIFGAPKRVEAIREGRYIPRKCALVWPRAALLEWASKNPE